MFYIIIAAVLLRNTPCLNLCLSLASAPIDFDDAVRFTGKDERVRSTSSVRRCKNEGCSAGD
jgi:hypothetical protein